MQRLIIVTGRSGAGRTTVLSVLEDFGYEAINNIPLGLVSKLIEMPSSADTVVLGIDVRSRDFTVSNFLDILQTCRAAKQYSTELIYLDASDDVLIRRYSETRRRHPMSPDMDPRSGVQQEARVLGAIKAQADTVLDTSDQSPHDLKSELRDVFRQDHQTQLRVNVMSFSYKRGLPRGVDMVWDCRFLRNPHWDHTLRPLSGLDGAVGVYITQDPNYAQFLEHVTRSADFLLPQYRHEGKSYFTIGFGCSGGRHRSVYVTEVLAKHLEKANWPVSVRHRELTELNGQD